jgi:hypothetical protein
MDAIRSDLFRLAQLVVALNATVVKLEGEAETHWKEEEKAFGQVDGRMKALDEGLRLDLSFDGIGGTQRPTLAVFILLVGVARAQPFFMLLCVLLSFLFDPLATSFYILLLVGLGVIRGVKKLWSGTRKWCKRIFPCCSRASAGSSGDVEAEAPVPENIPTSLKSRFSRFLTKVLLPEVNLFRIFSSAAAPEPIPRRGNTTTHTSRENILFNQFVQLGE